MAKKVENKDPNLLNLESETLNRLPMGFMLKVSFNDGTTQQINANFKIDIFEFFKYGQMVSTHKFYQNLN